MPVTRVTTGISVHSPIPSPHKSLWLYAQIRPECSLKVKFKLYPLPSHAANGSKEGCTRKSNQFVALGNIKGHANTF